MDAMGGCTFWLLVHTMCQCEGLAEGGGGNEVGAMCLLAPGNNLTSSKTIVEAGEDFAKLLSVVCSRGHPVSQQ